jgi:hypothetical protein
MIAYMPNGGMYAPPARVAPNPRVSPISPFMSATVKKRVSTVSAVLTVGFSFDDEPTVNSNNELTVATSGSHNLSRPSNCSLCACSFRPCATRSPSVRRR